MVLLKRERMNSVKTREKLLAAAVEIFAEKGFRDATISAVCMKCGANIAAVNYHFGSKEALYREAWQHAFEKSLQVHPPDGGIAADAPPEERLRGQVVALIRRVSDKKNREFWFIHREIANSTGLLGKSIREVMGPVHQQTANAIRELLGPQVAEREAKFCEVSLVSQCVNPMVIPHKLSVIGKKRDGLWRIADIEAYAEHVVAFSLAGIRALRKAAEGGGV
jgi:TetR/AcrR family transcriptional regulator, regulator of cefoperazone and chloramphenicol sensitivity